MNNSNTLKCLGLVFDKIFNYNEHLHKIWEKPMNVASKLVNAIRRMYGPAIIYGSEIWGGKAVSTAISHDSSQSMQNNADGSIKCNGSIPPW